VVPERHATILVFIGARTIELVVTTAATGHATITTNTQPSTGWMSFLSPNQPCQDTEGRQHHIPRIYLPHAHLGSSIFHGIAHLKLTWGLPSFSKMKRAQETQKVCRQSDG